MLLVVAAPVLGLLMGGVYSVPAIRLTGGREPWLSILLSGGLAVTVFGLGACRRVPAIDLMVVWTIAIGLLMAAKGLLGRLDRNLERFGMVHGLILLIVVLAPAVTTPANTK